jgi:hypothetical protein
VLRSTLPATALAALALTAPASAATLGTDARCYLSGGAVGVAGQGFAPGAPVTVQRGAQSVPVTADPSGAFVAEIGAPLLDPARAVVGRFAVTASDGAASARRRLRVTTFQATTKPLATRPGQVVTWRVAGFRPGARVWAHYVHGGRQVRQALFGRMPRRCGVLRKRIRQLPIANPASGRWRIQLDMRKRYRPTTAIKIVKRGRVTRG